LLPPLAEAVDQRDAPAIRKAAHALVSSVSILSAPLLRPNAVANTRTIRWAGSKTVPRPRSSGTASIAHSCSHAWTSRWKSLSSDTPVQARLARRPASTGPRAGLRRVLHKKNVAFGSRRGNGAEETLPKAKKLFAPRRPIALSTSATAGTLSRSGLQWFLPPCGPDPNDRSRTAD
jgi:hypothetical protein